MVDCCEWSGALLPDLVGTAHANVVMTHAKATIMPVRMLEGTRQPPGGDIMGGIWRPRTDADPQFTDVEPIPSSTVDSHAWGVTGEKVLEVERRGFDQRRSAELAASPSSVPSSGIGLPWHLDRLTEIMPKPLVGAAAPRRNVGDSNHLEVGDQLTSRPPIPVWLLPSAWSGGFSSSRSLRDVGTAPASSLETRLCVPLFVLDRLRSNGIVASAPRASAPPAASTGST